MRKTGFSEIIRDRHFRALAVPLRVAWTSLSWRRKHPQVPFWTLLDRFTNATTKYELYPQEYAPALTKLLEAIGRASPQLRYREDDLSGYLTLVGQEGFWLVAMFAAYASGKSSFVTPAQVAAVSGTAESTWRNKAAAGDIPAAIKAGKQWLLPTDVMEIVFGVELPDEAGQRDPADVAAEEAEALEPQMSEEDYHRIRRELLGADGLN